LSSSVRAAESVVSGTLDEIRAARDRHAARTASDVEDFIRLVERAYGREVDAFLERYRRDVVLRAEQGEDLTLRARTRLRRCRDLCD